MDETNLPPPAAVTADFARDIKPILNDSCIRCHSGQKPRSGFRLENRADGLKGGDNGVDIVPGHSGQSRLIYYVAQLVPDMEMPPPGKGEPLTPAQISLLRAWIDQGAAWETNRPADQFSYSLSPTLGGVIVSGADAQKFRELYWMKDGFNGGLAQLTWPATPLPTPGFPSPAMPWPTITNWISPCARTISVLLTRAGCNTGSISMARAVTIRF